MSNRTADAVLVIAEPIAEELGYEIIDIEYNRRKDADNELIIYIDKEGGVNIDDCERLSRALDEPLDESDPIPESYVLCVSSPGIDRPLKKEADYRRALGKSVEVKLYKKLNGVKDYVGILSDFDSEKIKLTVGEDASLDIDRKDIALIRLYVSF